MRLKELHLAGFKSFAKKTTLSFDAPITAIVGPNGSGKSNMAEAFRFALGEQSMKAMRGKRGDDLIWSGSRALPKANRASVKVVFDNTSRRLGLDFDSVALERAVFRDASHEYLVNGSRVRLKDVFELLASGQVGSSGHHIISQGEADRILLASPRDRRNMIEEALGLRIYQYRKAEAEKKRGETNANIKEVMALRRENAPHVAFLKKQVEKAEAARVFKEQLISLYQKYFTTEEFARTQAYEAAKERFAVCTKRHFELTSADSPVSHREEDLSPGRALLEREVLHEKMLAEVRARREALARESGRVEGALETLARAVQVSANENTLTLHAPAVPVAELEPLLLALEKEIQTAADAESMSVAHTILTGVREKIHAFIERFVQRTKGSDTPAPHVKNNQFSDEEMRRLQAEAIRLRAAHVEAEKEETALRKEHEALLLERASIEQHIRESERQRFSLEQHIRESEREMASANARVREAAQLLDEFKRERADSAFLYGKDVLNEPEDAPNQDGGNDHETRQGLKKEIERLKVVLEHTDPGAGDAVREEYETARDRDAFLARELADLEHAGKALAGLVQELDAELRAKFAEGVSAVSERFQELFSLMFDGGRASLVVVRSGGGVLDTDVVRETAEVDEEGIELDIALPHKRVRGLHALSGGERALASIALTFALVQVNPQPFLILDETDAALDEANSRRYGDMIERLADQSQLILITHNRETMSRAGILYGITMGADGCSQLLSVKFEEAVAVAK